jgi:hypothetical protein
MKQETDKDRDKIEVEIEIKGGLVAEVAINLCNYMLGI